jgi:hypothetical protein
VVIDDQDRNSLAPPPIRRRRLEARW